MAPSYRVGPDGRKSSRKRQLAVLLCPAEECVFLLPMDLRIWFLKSLNADLYPVAL